ncbi:hypothetical protein [Leeuwenhoekiella sp. NPDC079379]|uniref:hypothetical protein n=1 Tax=Leeuwenhoekiella sp. NPDC079379 TaxID=3364122 RepID=UPI0037CBE485
MGFYNNGEYYIVEKSEPDLIEFILSLKYFISNGLFSLKKVKSKIQRDYYEIIENIDFENINVPKKISVNEYEKQRFKYDMKESVFVYYIKSLSDYNLKNIDAFNAALNLLFRDIDLNSSKYFQKEIIEDFFKDLENNMNQYNFLIEYKKNLDNFNSKSDTKRQIISDQTLQSYFNDNSKYEKLIDGLIEVGLLNKEKKLIESHRIKSDLAVLIIKLNDSKIINTYNLSNAETVKLIKNTFGISPSSANYNKISNKKLKEINLQGSKSNDKEFYEKLNFIDSLLS